jgi:hypothetical protein
MYKLVLAFQWAYLLVTIPAAMASSPLSPDPDLPGVQNYYVYQDGNENLYDLICKDNHLLSPEFAAGSRKPPPLEIRRKAQQVCETPNFSQIHDFDVPTYGFAHFVVTDHGDLKKLELRLRDLHSVVTSARKLPPMPTIYFVFSVAADWYGLGFISTAVTKLNHMGYRVLIAQEFNAEDLIDIIGDDTTYGVSLQSHGYDPLNLIVTSFGGGQWADSNRTRIYPSDIQKVSKNLKFFSTMACYGDVLAEQYRAQLGLPVNAYVYLPNEHTNLAIEYYFRDQISDWSNSLSEWVAEPSDRDAIEHVRNTNFLQLLDLLPSRAGG